MKLPIPSFGKKNKQKYILALLLRDEKISALITEEVEGKMRIVGQHEEILTTSLEKLTEEAWLDALDRTISKAEETLPPDRETHDTVFGVKESWVEDKKIKKEYLLKLKTISDSLDLTPIGFLVISEAITHLIQAEEGAPVSAILVDIGKVSITATLVKGGNVLESHSLEREGSLPATVDTALKHFMSVDVFPSRVILFLGSSPVGEKEDIEHLAQQFITHHWSKNLPFLHAPQISVLNGGFDAKAVVQGAASQMGFEVLNLTLNKDDEIRNYDIHEKTSLKKTTHDASDEEKEETSDTTPPADEAFGFTLDNDVSENPPVRADNFEKVFEAGDPPKPHHAPVSHHQENATEETFAFSSNEALEMEDDASEDKETIVQKLSGLIAIGSLTKRFASLPLKGMQVPMLSGPGRNIILIPLVAIILLGGLYFYYTSTVKAEVTIYLKPNNVTETTDVLFSTDSGNDFSNNTIGAKTVSADIDGTVSTETSGKKAVGEKAKGNVTIYNNDDSKKQISAGTLLATDKGLKFTADKDVSVASASGDIFTGTKPGTAQVAVTAAEFGSDYNLPSGTKFNVSNTANIAAKNDSAFSGGTKKEVTVVSKKDQDKLLSDITKSLQPKALDELKAKTTDEQKLLEFLTQSTVTEKKFDRKVDDEAKKLTLNGTVSFEALTYVQKDIEDFAKTTLKNKYNDNLNLSEKGVSFRIENTKQKDEGEVAASLTIQAGLIPEINKESLIQSIEGQSPEDATAQIQKIPQVAKAQISFSPAIPFLPVFLPKGDGRIILNTAINE